jgi:hypothetical protein
VAGVRSGGVVKAAVLASAAVVALGGAAGSGMAAGDVGADGAARAVSKPTISPASGAVGTKVKVKGTCGPVGLGKVIQADVGFYYSDAWSGPAGYETFHEEVLEGRKAADYTVSLKVGPAHKYTTGDGVTPGPRVLRKPKAGDKLFVQTRCFYEGSAYPEYKTAKKKFSVTR